MAISGWSDSKMAQHYTKAAQCKRIIDAGFDRRKTYVARKNVPLSSNRNSGETNRGKTMEKQRPKTEMVGPEGTDDLVQSGARDRSNPTSMQSQSLAAISVPDDTRCT